MITNQLTKIIFWIIGCFYSAYRTAVIAKGVTRYLNRVYIIHQTRGPVSLCLIVKTARLAVTRYLAGDPLTGPIGIKLTSEGLPRLITKPLRDLVVLRDPRGISLVLTLLSLTRGILGGSKIDTDSIEKNGNLPSNNFDDELDVFVKYFNINLVTLPWSSFHWTTKMGPTGPAILTSLRDYRNLTPQLKSDLQLFGGKHIVNLFKVYDSWPVEAYNLMDKVLGVVGVQSTLRRISIKPDREAKSRLFGIVDYWSQTVLRPLHDHVFGLLKQFPADRTFTQGQGDHNLTPSSSYHSIDLQNATDRFPLWLQKKLVAKIVGVDKAEAWARILTSEGFDLKGRKLHYAAGQPMGAYSSWAVFSLCHHFVVWSASQRAGKPANWSNYLLLGDDIVIADDQVAIEYRGILQELGVPISETKTHTSPTCYEFAKRWWLSNIEVSPFPVWGLSEVSLKYYLLPGFFKEIANKGFDVTQVLSSNPVQIESWFKLLLGEKSRLARLLYYKYRLVLTIPAKGSDKDQVFKSAMQFKHLTKGGISCSWSPETVVRNFEQVASEVMIAMLEQAQKAALRQIEQWQQPLIQAGEELLGQEDYSLLVSYYNMNDWSPVVSALFQRVEESTESVGQLRMYYLKGHDIWDIATSIDMSSVVGVQGLIPERKTYRISRTIATLSARLEKRWTTLF